MWAMCLGDYVRCHGLIECYFDVLSVHTSYAVRAASWVSGWSWFARRRRGGPIRCGWLRRGRGWSCAGFTGHAILAVLPGAYFIFICTYITVYICLFLLSCFNPGWSNSFYERTFITFITKHGLFCFYDLYALYYWYWLHFYMMYLSEMTK